MSAEELSEYFYFNNRKRENFKIHARLNDQGIHLCRQDEQLGIINEYVIMIEDIFGSHCGPKLVKQARGGFSSCKRLAAEEQPHEDEQIQGQETSAYLYIYAYIKKDNPLRRVRTVRILRFCTFSKYEENLKLANRWHQAINTFKKKQSNPNDENQSSDNHREILILLNPKSGSGKAREMFQKQVCPVLNEAKISYDLHVTKYANFAREFVRIKRDLLKSYRGIIVASGDGLFYEVLNGLMERDDWQEISRQLPIGIIPCGSGNGLAKTIAHLYEEPYEPKPILHSTLTCVSGYAAPMDVVRVEVAQKDNYKEMYSFLSVGWGLIADIDIESERLRSIGANRFTLWSIRRVVNLRTYKGKVYYLPWRKKQAQQNQPDVQNIDVQKKSDDEFMDAISQSLSSVTSPYDSWHSAISRQTNFYSITDQSIRSQRNMASKIEEASAHYYANHSRGPVSTIPPPNMPLPESWQCVEGEFIMVHAAYTTHLASACLFAPASRLNDGIIYLVIIRAGIGRSQLAQFLLNLSTGTHLPDQPNENIQIVPVTAFRIEPNDVDGIITVDGERVEYGVIQGEIFPGLIKVMVPKLMTEGKDTHV